MIISLIKKLLNNTLYIRLGEDSVTLYDPKREKTKVYRSDRKFSNERLAVSSFIVAEDFLSKTVKDFYSVGLFHPAPLVIMHQEYKTEGGLGEVEIRVLRELALSAGAREVHVWEGAKLSREQIANEVYI
jgi:rod shape-determining protein MreB